MVEFIQMEYFYSWWNINCFRYTYENRQFIAYKEALIINGGVLLACSNNNSIIDPKIAEKKEQYLNHINSDTKLGIYNN